MVSTKQKYENRASQFLLKVGQHIRNTNHINHGGLVGTIIKFKRGKVMCNNGLIFFQIKRISLSISTMCYETKSGIPSPQTIKSSFSIIRH